MSINLVQAPTKEQYFTTGADQLYYVVEISADGDFLIEDCKTLDLIWITADSMAELTCTPVVVSK